MDERRETETLPQGDGEQLLLQRFRLRVIKGPDEGAVYTAKRSSVSIGADRSNDFVLRDPTLSGFHCEISFSEGRPVLRDLGSSNGTLVDGVGILVAPLSREVTLTLGRTEIRFELDADPVRVALSGRTRFGLLRGRSGPMRAVFAVLERAADSDATVLLQGETGTGKDLAAESIHLESARKDGPFIIVDCGAIPANLMESELFGHEKGAFTGADRTRAGAFQMASGGTLFLDEIGELPLEVQPKLLRVLETRKVQRVGGTGREPVDVRIIAATHRSLRQEINEQRFRSDLYYRLAVLQVMLPPLRERMEDLPILIEAILEAGSGPSSGTEAFLTEEFLAELRRHSWPGNVRELRNYLERCVAFQGQPPSLRVDALSDPLAIDATLPLSGQRDRWLKHQQRRYLEELLRLHGGNVAEAARGAGVTRVHLYRLMSSCGVRRGEDGGADSPK